MTDPMLHALITDAQRDRAVDYLQRAYAAGGLSEELFEARLGQALTATTRAELNASLAGIARVAPTMMQVAHAERRPQEHGPSNLVAGLVHLSALPSCFILPAIARGLAAPGSRIAVEASRAMCFQFSAVVYGTIALILVALGLAPVHVLLFGFLAWGLLTLWLAIRAFSGEHSTKLIQPLMLMRPAEDRGLERMRYTGMEQLKRG